jgi:predicted RNase H-like HicB family nuclease
MRYPAVVTKEGKNLLAVFPTCPGCHTFAPQGRDIEHEAKEALELWLESHHHWLLLLRLTASRRRARRTPRSVARRSGWRWRTTAPTTNRMHPGEFRHRGSRAA